MSAIAKDISAVMQDISVAAKVYTLVPKK